MDVVFLFQLILPFLNNLLKYSYSQSTPQPGCCSPTHGDMSPDVRKVWMLDLNTTFFINSVVVKADTNDTDSISVDIGTTSCNTFQDTACFVWCNTREVLPQNGHYVTVNITCNVPNVKGRYVRVRQNRPSDLALCNVRVMGRSSTNKELQNYALNAECWRSWSSPPNFRPTYAVDGKPEGSVGRKPTCSRTESSVTMTHWWMVDLGKIRLVSYITIAGAKDSSVYGRLTNFTVDVNRWNDRNNERKQCLYFNGTAKDLNNLTCTGSIWGRYVNISKTGRNLTLCEVEVYSDVDENRPVFSQEVANFSCDSLNESEQNATSLEIPEENFNESENGIKQPWEEENMDEIDYCTNCNCHFPVAKSPESVQQEVKEAQKELKVETKEMSQQVRKKTSVPDQRLSSQAVGLICVVTLSSIFTVVIACDACRLLHYLLHSRNKHLKV